MDKQQVCRLLAQILAGAQVPVSINPMSLGAGYDAYWELRTMLNLTGWRTEEEYFEALVCIFDPLQSTVIHEEVGGRDG